MAAARAMQRAREAAADSARLLTRVGMAVDVRTDSGKIQRTVTASVPWMLGGGLWIVKLEGFSGGYDCARVKLAEGPRMAPSAKVILDELRRRLKEQADSLEERVQKVTASEGETAAAAMIEALGTLRAETVALGQALDALERSGA